jgi:hypothetical protein
MPLLLTTVMAGLPEGLAALDDCDPEALWCWELRDPRKTLTAAPNTAKMPLQQGAANGQPTTGGVTAAAAHVIKLRKMVDVLRKRRKQVGACTSINRCSLQIEWVIEMVQCMSWAHPCLIFIPLSLLLPS